MIREIKAHSFAYFFLTLLLVGYVIAFLAAWPNHGLQRIIALMLGVTYIIWGVTTHLKTESITKKVFWEYMGVGLLASTLLILVTI